MGRTWQEELRDNVTTVDALAEVIDLDDEKRRGLEKLGETFPFSISRYYLSLADLDDPDDPILKMCLPDVDAVSADGNLDTSGEASNTVLPGLQHKYEQTALLLTSNQCAMYCRHCFRRRMVGVNDFEVVSCIDDAVAYVKAHPEINNVLLSGGDALVNSNERIEEFLAAFSALPQLDFIRIGTRTPVTFPDRILLDEDLQEILFRYNQIKQIYLITHFNHPNECTQKSHDAVRSILGLGIPVKDQTVLLRGVNDDAQVLGSLLRTMTAWGIVPHYVFQCRPVTGVKSRFQVPLVEGFKIVAAANAMQNGLGKSVDYTMSNPQGKIQFVGLTDDGKLVMRFQEAKDPALIGKVFIKDVGPDVCWIDHLE